MLDNDTFIESLPAFYEAYQTPIFLLDSHFKIIHQPSNFMSLSSDFFTKIFQEKKLMNGKLTTIFRRNELYMLFRYEHSPMTYCCIGPILYRRVHRDINLKSISFFRDANLVGDPIKLLQAVPYLDNHNTPIVKLIYFLVTGDSLQSEDIHNSYTDHRAYVNEEESIFQQLYQRREQMPTSSSYQDEANMLHFIKEGNSASARIYASKIAGGRIGKMSEDELRKNKYAMVALITMITRAVLEIGVSNEQAFTMSDLYIQRTDACFSSQQIFDVCNDVIIDFCSLVRKSKQNMYPKWIHDCMQYIHEHLHTTITLEEISETVHMSPTYVSVQYKKITGTSLRQYINSQRVLEAKYLLKNTTMSIQEIAINLDYSTQSYFTQVFKAETGCLPNEFRKSKQRG